MCRLPPRTAPVQSNEKGGVTLRFVWPDFMIKILVVLYSIIFSKSDAHEISSHYSVDKIQTEI